MKRWFEYTQERFPLSTYTILAGGISLSGIFLDNGPFQYVPFLLSFFGLILFFFELRLMDELKDYEKDKLAHPDRPLPSGLLSTQEVKRGIDTIIYVMFAYGIVLWVFLQSLSALAYFVIIGYLWLMYKEFYFGHWLTRRPILYAVSHQLIIIPVAFFAVCAAWPVHGMSEQVIPFCLVLLGSFFCYEVCRKLDPYAHPILMTYIHFYGFKKTFFIALAALIVSAIGAFGIGLGPILWAFEGLVLLSLLPLFVLPRFYRVPEIAASLSLVVHVWSGVIQKIGDFLWI